MAFFGGGRTSERSDGEGQRKAKNKIFVFHDVQTHLLPGSLALAFVCTVGWTVCGGDSGEGRGKLDTVGGRAKNEKEGGNFFLGVGESMHQNARNVTKFQSLEEIQESGDLRD